MGWYYLKSIIISVKYTYGVRNEGKNVKIWDSQTILQCA